jgi:hypothetical protein
MAPGKHDAVLVALEVAALVVVALWIGALVVRRALSGGATRRRSARRLRDLDGSELAGESVALGAERLSLVTAHAGGYEVAPVASQPLGFDRFG